MVLSINDFPTTLSDLLHVASNSNQDQIIHIYEVTSNKSYQINAAENGNIQVESIKIFYSSAELEQIVCFINCNTMIFIFTANVYKS